MGANLYEKAIKVGEAWDQKDKEADTGRYQEAVQQDIKVGGILIVAKNNLHLTKATVRTALAQNVPCKVLVVDNASTDGTGAWLKSKDISTIHYRESMPLSKCWNVGLRAFFLYGVDCVLVLNNDVEIHPTMFRSLAGLDLPFVTGVGVDTREQMEASQTMATLTPHPDFSAFMIRQSVTERVGWFDEGYPIYCEDCDYHIRMHRKGIPALCSGFPFLHVGAGSQTVKNCSPQDRTRIQKQADVSRERFHTIYGCLPGSVAYEKLFL